MYQGYEPQPPEDDEPNQPGGPIVRTAHPTEVERLTATLVAGGGQMDLCRWLAPKARHRQGILTGYTRILVTHLLAHGQVEVIDGPRAALAVAGWLPSHAPAVPAGYAEQVAQVAGPWAVRFQALDDELARLKAPGHRRLVFLAVYPPAQEQGLGSALLAHHARVLDERGVSACAVAVDGRAVGLLGRHGFSPHGQPIAVAVGSGGQCALIPMRRHPRPPVGVTTVTGPASRSRAPRS